jgi:PAS domain S-box-containing protein
MPDTLPRTDRADWTGRWTAALLIALTWTVVVVVAIARLGQSDRIVVAIVALVASAMTLAITARFERVRWRTPIENVTRFVRDLVENRHANPTPVSQPELAELTMEISALAKTLASRSTIRRESRRRASRSQPKTGVAPSTAYLTRSGLFNPALLANRPSKPNEPTNSGEYSTIDMVNRLEPLEFRWIESSTAEQILLGWTLEQLRRKSFLDAVHPDDRGRAEETFALALVRGEALGLVIRMQTAHGNTLAIEVNVSARYGANHKVTHLRCHLTDVTDKVRAERDLRLRSLELTQVNEQLRRINRELEDLKNRYSDLYEHAPAMYFSLDLQGVVIECNQTMLVTLNKARDQIVGRPYEGVLYGRLADGFKTRYGKFLEKGVVERETRWVKSGGEQIDVWVTGSVVPGSKNSPAHARFVAQDVTARRLLEAELSEKNQSLARANDELFLRNRELDEFVYVVSHDLQEPLRTLTAFSDFLLRDYGDLLVGEGQEYVRYLVDASRRMRSMIHGMLKLSRAGKVIGTFTLIDLDELVAEIKADLGELFRTSGAALKVKSPLPRIWGDRARIRQLLANLITNGIKYNKSPDLWVEIKGDVGVIPDTTGVEGGPKPETDVTIAVTDNGIGIDPQFHASIFQLFKRLHTRDEYEGTGVGLAICNKIVQAHGGRIWVESALGRGSTFFFKMRSRVSSPVTTHALSQAASASAYGAAASQVSEDEPNSR